MAGATKLGSDLPPLIAQILAARGLKDPDARAAYLAPSLRQLPDPASLPGVSEAARAIAAALDAGKSVVVFGDYDCDGVCATAILVRTLAAILGARGAERVEPFIPLRLEEGYGMSDAAIARMLAEHPNVGLVVTVDNGINSVTQIAALKARGIGVVVTDHHLPGEETPVADAVVDPKVRAPAELENLCGAGVAFLLANELIRLYTARGSYKGPSIAGPLLVLAGLATVTDVMPLVGVNRVFVSQALAHFRTCAPLGLRALYERAARAGAQTMTSRDFGFLLGPRINAAGRIASGMESLELILSDDSDIAREAARIVDGRNTERKNAEQSMTEAAMALVVPDAPAQVIHLPNAHPGIVGIVAARVQEKLGGTVPVCVIADDPTLGDASAGRGSARSQGSINIRDAFTACADELLRYGGHAAAGGFSVKPGRIDAFREKLCAHCAAMRGAGAPTPVRTFDAAVDPLDLTGEQGLEIGEWIAKMEPFGEGNEEPVFKIGNVTFSDVRPLGQDGKHLQLALARSGLRTIWWNHGDLADAIRATPRPRELYVTLAISDYGTRHLELRVVDVV